MTNTKGFTSTTSGCAARERAQFVTSVAWSIPRGLRLCFVEMREHARVRQTDDLFNCPIALGNTELFSSETL